MYSDYNVFICHRGCDTKKNVVSVLQGMLHSKGITCFVDYKMDEGSEVNFAIQTAIESALVHIIVLSPEFKTSSWCLDEVLQIMNIQKSIITCKRPRKVIPVFYDTESFMDMHKPDVKRSTAEQLKGWVEALESLLNFKSFKYNSESAFEWEELDHIVSEVEDFLISHNVVPYINHHRERENTWEIDMHADYESVFICHYKKDTQRNVVSVLRGILRSRGVTCVVVDYEKEGTSMKSDIDKAIRKSSVHVIIFSQNFVNSKQCLEEIIKIMNVFSSEKPQKLVLPIFYDVEPYVVRHQPERSTYNLQNVEGSTTEDRERWAKALKDLSHLKGFEYDTAIKFQWETLDEIARKIEASLKMEVVSCHNEHKCGNLYQEKLNQALEVLESDDFNSKDVFFIGVYERSKTQFVELVVQKLCSRFDAFCILSNVTDEVRQPDGLSDLVRKLYSDLIRKPNDEPLSIQDFTMYRPHYEQLLRSKRCFVVFNDIGNESDNIKRLLQVVKQNLRNRSLVVLVSEFQNVLQREVTVDKFISLWSLEDTKGILLVCYGNKSDIHEAFLDELQETFFMLGLEVHLLSKEELAIDSTSLEKSQVILCIISQSLSIGEFDEMLLNAAIRRPKVLYLSYGRDFTDEGSSKACFKLNVNFEDSELNKAEFKAMVNEVARTLNKGHEEIIEATSFPVGLTERVNDMWAQMSSYLSSSTNALQCFGLLGMGGLGKTTTAMSIYNKIHGQFEASFLSLNTRASVAASASSLVSLQREILRSLLSKKQIEDVRIKKAAHDKARFSSSRMHPAHEELHELHGSSGPEGMKALDLTNDELHGNALLSSRLKGINALVVLDDVDSKEQLEALYDPLCSSLGPKSLVIITSRDRDILERAQSRHIFEIQGLNLESSRRLFYWHAFLKPEAPPHLKEVSESVIAACKGLPLSLKVMGAHLYRKNDKRYWDESFNFLRENERDILSVLRKSLDGLESAQRDSFLDICCFFVGETDSLAVAYLEGVYEMGWTHLKLLNSRCLLTLDRDETTMVKQHSIRVHDHLCDMGRRIVRNEDKNRAWDEQTAKDLLKDERTRSALRGLSINSAMALPHGAAKLRSLPHLSFLRVIGDSSDRESFFWNHTAGNVFENVQCDELRFLGWRNAPFEQLPRGLCSTNLRVLDLRDSKIEELPSDQALFMNLRHLDLAGTKISRVPRRILCDNLQYLNLSGTKIKELPSAASCPYLRQLYLSKTKISQVPHRLCSAVLEILDLSETNIRQLPVTKLRDLVVLNLQGCKRLDSLSAISGASMPSLQRLNLDECECLQALDAGIASLTVLRHLGLSRCHRMTCLPQEITKLSSLEVLDLQECTSLKALSFLPTSLQNLELDGCSNLQTLNVSGASLPNLRMLSIVRCTNLREPPCGELPCLETFYYAECAFVKTLSFLPTTVQALGLIDLSRKLHSVSASLPNLQKLKLFACDGVEEFLASKQASFFGELSSLVVLHLLFVTSLKTLAFLPTTLQELSLASCVNLRTVNTPLPNLRILDLKDCRSLITLPTALGACMRELNLTNCNGLKELLAANQTSFFRDLCSLQQLHLSWCTSLETLSYLPTSLEELNLWGCRNLKVIDLGSGNPLNLKRLDIRKCPCLRSLPEEIERLPSLTIIRGRIAAARKFIVEQLNWN